MKPYVRKGPLKGISEERSQDLISKWTPQMYRLIGRFPVPGISGDDMFQELCIVLMKCSLSYDPKYVSPKTGRRAVFQTFFYNACKNKLKVLTSKTRRHNYSIDPFPVAPYDDGIKTPPKSWLVYLGETIQESDGQYRAAKWDVPVSDPGFPVRLLLETTRCANPFTDLEITYVEEWLKGARLAEIADIAKVPPVEVKKTAVNVRKKFKAIREEEGKWL